MNSIIPSTFVFPDLLLQELDELNALNIIDNTPENNKTTNLNNINLNNIILPELQNLPENKELTPLQPLQPSLPPSPLKYIKPSGVSICLNMIVRNESKIIKRLLQSVLPIIDTYVICDTGSTDDTVTIIKDFFDSKGIDGEVVIEPFKNFGYNRTFALKSARNKATYALLLDADMIFKIEPTFNKQVLKADSYLIIQKGGGLTYYNTRLIRLDIDSKCVGPTHEYYDLPQGSKSEKLDSIWIDDIGDGGSKANKFERDIRLLKDGIEEEPQNGRYYFYLANSYFNSSRHNESIQYYKKRIELGGWVEEIFYSYLNLGHAYMTTNQPEMAISNWMEGYNHHPTRSETIYQICKYYREKGKNKIAMPFCMLGKSIPYPKNDTLFIHQDVYDTGFDYELSILGYYNNYSNIYKVICKLMNKESQNYNNMLSNYKFYYPKLSSASYLIKKIGGTSIKDTINVCGTEYKMNASNPCIFKIKGTNNSDSSDSSNLTSVKYMVNVRFVNYLVNRNGSYHFDVNDGKIATVNKIYELDADFNMIGEPIVLMPDNNNLRYVGMEDLKPFYVGGFSESSGSSGSSLSNIVFVGTCENPNNNKLSMGYGELNLDDWKLDSKESNLESNLETKPKFEYSVVSTPYNKDCEKNWVFFKSANDELQIIYQWYPLTIGKIEKSNNNQNKLVSLDIKDNKNMPPYFKNTRGSSNGCEINNEIWFLCHVVEYCQPREYYHFFAVFDKNTMDIKKWSNLFKFDGEKIEYALGMIVEETRIIISYSKWDSDPTIGIFDKKKIESELFLV